MSASESTGAGTSNADCEQYLESIVYFIDNELDAASCAEVRVHLDECNPCLAKYDLQLTVKSVIARSCSESAPTELRARVLTQIRQVQGRISRLDE